MQKTIEKSKNIFDENGEVTFGGWSKKPLFEYNKSECRIQNKLVEKDSYYISNSEMGFYISVKTEGSELSARIILIDYKSQQIVRDYVSKKLWLEPQALPQSPNFGEFKYTDKKAAITITNTVDGRYIKCDFIDFNNYKNLFVKVKVKSTNGESMNLVSPFDKNPKCFYHKRFIPHFTANGVVRLGGKDYILDDENSFVYLDWSRYMLLRHKKFQVLSTACDADGIRLAVNFASKVGNNKKGSENCYFIHNSLYKVGRLKVTGDDKKPDSKWQFSTADNMVQLEFTPDKKDNAISLCKCGDLTVIFGKLNGALASSGGDIEIKNINAHTIFTHL